MEKGSIFDEPLFRLSAVLLVIVAVITLIATNAVYFGEQLPVAKVPRVATQAIEIQVVYEGDWSGIYGGVGRSISIEGTGTETISFPDAAGQISASIRKQDDSAETLTVQILKNGVVVAEEATAEAYGIASVVYRLL